MDELNWIEISVVNLRHNLNSIQNYVGPNTIVCPCIKANAYGHGLTLIGNLFSEFNIKYICVNSIHEAVSLRSAGYKSHILVLGYINISKLSLIIEHQITPVIYSTQIAKNISRIAALSGKTISVHAMVDTGMNREGFNCDNFINELSDLTKISNIRLDGIATHFATASNGTNDPYYQQQLFKFITIRNQIKQKYPNKEFIFHAASSAATLLDKSSHFDLVRPGISLFGYYPNETVRDFAKKNEISVKPVLTLKTRIAHIREIQKGDTVSYGRHFTASSHMRIALLPIGYADGLNKQLSNNYSVIINNKRARLIGKVCMNMVMADITDIPSVNSEDEVIVLGFNNDEEVSLYSIANRSGLSKGEFLTNLKESIVRIIV